MKKQTKKKAVPEVHKNSIRLSHEQYLTLQRVQQLFQCKTNHSTIERLIETFEMYQNKITVLQRWNNEARQFIISMNNFEEAKKEFAIEKDSSLNKLLNQ